MASMRRCQLVLCLALPLCACTVTAGPTHAPRAIRPSAIAPAERPPLPLPAAGGTGTAAVEPVTPVLANPGANSLPASGTGVISSNGASVVSGNGASVVSGNGANVAAGKVETSDPPGDPVGAGMTIPGGAIISSNVAGLAPQAASRLSGLVRVPVELLSNNAGSYRLAAAGATAPAPGVEVGLVDAGGALLPGTSYVKTDASGRYAFESVPAGVTPFVQARLSAGGRTYLLGALAPLPAALGNVVDVSPASSLVAGKARAVIAEQDTRPEAFDTKQLGALLDAADGALAGASPPDFSQPAAGAQRFDQLLQANGALAGAARALDRNVGTPMVRVKQRLAGGVFSPEHLAYNAAGDLFIAGLNDHTIWKLPAGSGTLVAWAKNDQLKWPHGIAVDPAGNVYVGRRIDLYHDDPANPGHDDTPGKQVFKIDPTGQTVTALPYTFASPAGMCFDKDGHTLYVVNAGANGGELLAYDTPSNQVRQLAHDLAYGNGVAQDGTGTLYVTHLRAVWDDPDPQKNGWRGCISRVLPTGAATLFYAGYLDVTGSDMLEGVAIDRADNLYVTNNWGNTIFKFTPKQKKIETFLKFDQPTGIAFDTRGNLAVANYITGDLSLITP